MKDFWQSCGYLLTERGADGHLVATNEFLKAYLARPELNPPTDACAAERALHAALLADVRHTIPADEIAAIADADARENWQLMVDFRDHLLRHPTIEQAYVDLVRAGVGGTPPLFLDQLVQVILRNALDGSDDPFLLRAGELLFRPQRVTVHEGALLVADEERIAARAGGLVSPLVSMLGIPAAAEIDILTVENAETYWERSDRFDMAFDLTIGRRGVSALADVLTRWLRHLLSIEVTIEPIRELRDVPLTWYVGLEAEGTRIGNTLWESGELNEDARSRVVALFGLRFAEPHAGGASIEDNPVYLILAMTGDKGLRMKPQNLLVGLPQGIPAAVV